MSKGASRGVTLGTLLGRRRERGSENDALLSVTQDKGVIPQDEAGRRNVSSADKTTYWRVYPDDIVYNTMRMWQGASARSDHFGIVSPAYTVCCPASGVSSRFLSYALKLREHIKVFRARSQGLTSDVWSLRFEELARIELQFVPGYAQQERIVEILSSVDDAIEKTQAVIDQAQVLKRGLMQELLTRGLPGRHTRFKQTEIGEIPEEWSVVSLGDCGATVTSGSRGWARYYSNNGALFLRITNLARNTIRLQLGDIRHVVLPGGSAESSRTLVQSGDLLISITADLGMVGVIPDGIGEAYVNQHLALVRLPGHELHPEFAGYSLATDSARNRFNRLNDSGAKAGLNLPTIMKLTVPKPPRDEQDLIVKILTTMEDRLTVEGRKLDGLTVAKSALMSVLLTGELRVTPDTEAA